MAEHRIRDQRQPKHFWADNEIVDRHLSQIGMAGFAVYMLLCRYANNDGQCDPSVAGMASRLQVSQPTVRKAVKALESARLIEVKRGRSTAKGDPDTHLYSILSVKGGVLNQDKGVLNQIEEGTKRGIGGVLNHVSPNNTDLEQDSKNKTPIQLMQPANAVASRTSDPLGDDIDSQPIDPKAQKLLDTVKANTATERLSTTIQENGVPTDATVADPQAPSSAAPLSPVDAALDIAERDSVQAAAEMLRQQELANGKPLPTTPLVKAAKKPKTPKPESDLPPLTNEAKDALALECYGTVTAWNYAPNASAMGKALRDCKNPTAEQIKAHQRWWNVNDFRGRKGQRPRPHQVAETWAEALQELSNGNGRLLGNRAESRIRYDDYPE